MVASRDLDFDAHELQRQQQTQAALARETRSYKLELCFLCYYKYNLSFCFLYSCVSIFNHQSLSFLKVLLNLEQLLISFFGQNKFFQREGSKLFVFQKRVLFFKTDFTCLGLTELACMHASKCSKTEKQKKLT